MRVAIISNGPSASLFNDAEWNGYKTVIAVNEAASLWRCQWWVLIDWSAFQRITPLGSPVLFTRVSTPGLVKDNAKADAVARMSRMLWQGHVFCHEHMPRPWLPEGTPPWNTYSGTAALILAWHLRAEAIDVYGADMGGESDCVGTVKSGMRRKERWTHERRIWEGIMAMFAGQGIEVRRITNGED